MPSALYIFWILHQTTTAVKQVPFSYCCISFESYIKPQLDAYKERQNRVVYLLNPTSNHNSPRAPLPFGMLYIFWILHQTTTQWQGASQEQQLYIFWILHQTTTWRCSGLWYHQLYIFWILHQTTTDERLEVAGGSCISFESYIKPQPHLPTLVYKTVVYLLNPTSNHNYIVVVIMKDRLYIFWILHQTTTLSNYCQRTLCCISFESYIKPQHTDFAYWWVYRCISFESYIKPQPSTTRTWWTTGCISFESYIKPQHTDFAYWWVYRCISFESYIKPQPSTTRTWWTTGCISFESYIKPQRSWGENPCGVCCISFESYIKPQPMAMDNKIGEGCISFESYIKPQRGRGCGGPRSVVYLLNPTSNHNVCRFPSFTPWLYIFWILHQTTTLASWQIHILSCISFESYIKPQRVMSSGGGHLVVYLLNPTSNHNCSGNRGDAGMVVYLLNPTSNHNSETSTLGCCIVVYLLNPTSNHNERKNASCILRLYIFWILHQTTTIKEEEYLQMSCISFESYIKPQPRRLRSWVVGVVYLLNPTSNHDPILILILFIMLYIFWILHQTTTRRRAGRISTGCISFESYIKPQLMCFFIQLTIVVYLLNPTSNHN